MSWFNRALELCGDAETREYFRALYWARAHKTAAARHSTALRAAALREALTTEQADRAARALDLRDQSRRR